MKLHINKDNITKINHTKDNLKDKENKVISRRTLKDIHILFVQNFKGRCNITKSNHTKGNYKDYAKKAIYVGELCIIYNLKVQLPA